VSDVHQGPVALEPANGKVLVAGGVCSPQTTKDPSVFDPDDAIPAAELYDPATGKWTATGSMTTERYLHTATLLNDGEVLVAGAEHQDGIVCLTGPTADIEGSTANPRRWMIRGQSWARRLRHRPFGSRAALRSVGERSPRPAGRGLLSPYGDGRSQARPVSSPDDVVRRVTFDPSGLQTYKASLPSRALWKTIRPSGDHVG